MNSPALPAYTRSDLIQWGAAAVLLAAVLWLKLLSALFVGLLVHELVFVLASRMGLRAVNNQGAKIIAVVLISALVVAGATLGIAGLVNFLRHGEDSLPALLKKLAEILDASRQQLPPWAIDYLPADAEELRKMGTEWLRANAKLIPTAGRDVLLTVAHMLIGMVIGALLAIRSAAAPETLRPLARAIQVSAQRLATSFRRVVFAQVWISAINTTFTAVYLAIVLPMLDIQLPLVKTLIVITFVAGLIPILGNLISNTAIVLASLSVSMPVAIGSLAFLVGVHKLEYFLNARIVGSHIRAQAWELLTAMLLMEAMFGITGLIAAPIYYAYFKDAFAEKQLI